MGDYGEKMNNGTGTGIR
jgi:hypothetical protein